MKLNPDRLRALLEAYKEQKGIPYTRLGEVLGSKSDTVQGKSALAKKALERPEELSLVQIQALADFMDRPVESLIFGDNNAIVNIGDENQNIVQTGSGNTVRMGSSAKNEENEEAEDIHIFRTLSPAKRKALLELLK